MSLAKIFLKVKYGLDFNAESSADYEYADEQENDSDTYFKNLFEMILFDFKINLKVVKEMQNVEILK